MKAKRKNIVAALMVRALYLTMLLFITCFNAFISVDRAQAATFTIHEENEMGCTITMEGVIVEGDAERFRQTLADYLRSALREEGPAYPSQRLCLDSPGGSFLEAISIADTMAFCYLCTEKDDEYGILSLSRWRSQKFSRFARNTSTAVGSGMRCESACSIIFMAGGQLMLEGNPQRLPDRILHISGALGFHAPTISLPDGSHSSQFVTGVYDGAVETISLLRQRLIGYRFHVDLFGQMISTPPSSMLYVERVGQLAAWSIGSSGIPNQASITQYNVANFCHNHTLPSPIRWRETYGNSAPEAIRRESLKTAYSWHPPLVMRPAADRFDLGDFVDGRRPFFEDICGGRLDFNQTHVDADVFASEPGRHLLFPAYVTLAELAALTDVLSGDAHASYSAAFFSAVEDVFDASCGVYEDFTLVAERNCQVIYRTAESLDGTIVRQQTQIIGLEEITVERRIGGTVQCPPGSSSLTPLFRSSSVGHLIELEDPLELGEYVNGEWSYSDSFPEFRRSEQCVYYNEEPSTTPFSFCIQALEGAFICTARISYLAAEERPPLEERGI